jgi:hypothetical protein
MAGKENRRRGMLGDLALVAGGMVGGSLLTWAWMTIPPPPDFDDEADARRRHLSGLDRPDDPHLPDWLNQ